VVLAVDPLVHESLKLAGAEEVGFSPLHQVVLVCQGPRGISDYN
jgi:hypothetical protein